MDQLLAFRPIFEAPGFEPVESWAGRERSPGVFTWPYPRYSDAVDKFIDAVLQEVWMDRDYALKDVNTWFENPALIKRASLDDIKTLLSFAVRKEKFCDGHVEGMIKGGHVQLVLRRLSEVRDEYRQGSVVRPPL